MAAMRLNALSAGVLACLLGIPAMASGQDAPVKLGTRVRVTVPCDILPQSAQAQRKECRITGMLGGWRPDAIDVDTSGTRRTFNLNTLRWLEVSRGSRGHWGLGARIGLVLGAGVTYLILQDHNASGSTDLCNTSTNQDAIGAGSCLAIIAGAGVAGAGLGALIGGLIRTERWQIVSHGRAGISLVMLGRSTLGFAVTF
jgi:hypothetical protein